MNNIKQAIIKLETILENGNEKRIDYSLSTTL